MKSMNFPKNVNNRKNVIFIGQTSVGKSSLINALFGTKCKTSKGRCTKGIIAVA
jgi:GTP-binding protein EngB required for normal cell division